MKKEYFTQIRPQISDFEYGKELNLRDILIGHFNIFFDLTEAERLADLYISKWVVITNKLED